LLNYQPIYKKILAKDPAYYFNVYTCHCTAALGLGLIPYIRWRVYPTPGVQELPENHWYLGVIIDWQLLTGSNVFNGRWSQGLILVHEAGHHYGLNHLYTGGCIGDETASDNIADTPRQMGNPSESCQKAKGTHTCPKLPRVDDISNYMGIYWDSCRSHFTPGQVNYMRWVIKNYKPTLLKNSTSSD